MEIVRVMFLDNEVTISFRGSDEELKKDKSLKKILTELNLNHYG